MPGADDGIVTVAPGRRAALANYTPPAPLLAAPVFEETLAPVVIEDEPADEDDETVMEDAARKRSIEATEAETGAEEAAAAEESEAGQSETEGPAADQAEGEESR